MKLSTKRRFLFLLLLFSVFLMAGSPGGDITGTGATVQIASSGSARWVQIIADSTNSAVVRTDQDSSVSATVGLKIPAGGGFLYPPQGQNYRLAGIYVYIANGDKISVIWGNQ